jgi:hypothetical protein
MNLEVVFRPKTRAMQLLEIQRGIDLSAYLQEEYVTKGRKQSAIASDLGVDIGTVSRWMAHFGLPTRRSAA